MCLAARTETMHMDVDLFSQHPTPLNHHHALPMRDADVVIIPQLFTRREADRLLSDLIRQVAWKQERITIYGKDLAIPRMTAWHGDTGKSYTYSGLRLDPSPWTPTLLTIKDKIEEATGESFNSVLLNFYRSGADGVSWHSDNEAELGGRPTIGSVSFGEERPFQMKHKRDVKLKQTIMLPHGSLLMMRGDTQANWLHQVPKSSKAMLPRINLTFRSVQ